MLFSRKPNELSVQASDAGLPANNISLSRKEKIQASILMGTTSFGSLGLAALLRGDVFTRLATINPEGLIIGGGVGLGLTSLLGLWVTTMFVTDILEGKVIEQTNENPRAASRLKVAKAIKASKKDRTLIESFNIRDVVEVNVDYWRKAPVVNVPLEEATHTVNHYLIKEKNGYRMEQEIDANDETVWDLSANALVEVYGVQEKTKMKGLTHE